MTSPEWRDVRERLESLSDSAASIALMFLVGYADAAAPDDQPELKQLLSRALDTAERISRGEVVS